MYYRKTRNNQRNKLRKASVLLETILALLFAVITITAVASLLSVSMKHVRQAENHLRAMLLSESKLAEITSGLTNLTETRKGEFSFPKEFSWEYEYQPTEISRLNHIILTVSYDDPQDGFGLCLHQFVCPILHLNSSQLREISSDPSELQSITSGTGFSDIISYAELLPGGENLLRVFLAGGVPAMTELFNRIVTGQIDPQQLMESSNEFSEEQDQIASLFSSTEQVSTIPPQWTDYDTAGIGEKPQELQTQQQIAQQITTEQQTQRESASQQNLMRTGPMTRQQALQRIQEMLRRLAEHNK